jgi:hypothetical protein
LGSGCIISDLLRRLSGGGGCCIISDLLRRLGSGGCVI